jgi:hypothetical protein
MTADVIIDGIDDAPSARAALPLGQLRTPDRPEQRFAPVKWSTGWTAQEMCVYPVVAHYVYPDGSGWSVGIRQ